MQSFMKIKPLQNNKITLLFPDVCKSCPNREIFNVANMYFSPFRENFLIYSIC